ncbi:MAG: EAL domain-containing protein, partial [Acidimicrobiales bacterium]
WRALASATAPGHDLPLALVKLDKSFVQGIAGQPGRLSLASSVIGLAHALNAEVVAEGVENTADLDAVRYLGCDLAQGFLLARPGPPERVPGLEPGRPRVLRRNWRDGRPDAPETTDDLGQPIIDLRGIDEQPRWP